MKAAATYARVSSEQQKEENTIASQTAALIEFAREQGYGVPDEWVVEDEGFSGASLLRPGLERLRDLAAEGHIQAVLIHAPDRLSRKYAYQVLLTEEFARHGVETIFLKAPHSGTPEDQLMLQFQGMIAEYERAQILERSRRGKRHRAKAGEVSVLGGAPYGYRYIRKTRDAPARYEIDAVEAEVVRLVYDMYTVKGLSIGAIARLLRETGPPTRRRVTRWERSVVWAILRNPAYKGAACFNKTQVGRRQKVTRPFRLSGRAVHGEKSCSHERPRDEWIEIPVPAIVSDEAFALAAERLADNKRFAPRRTIEPSIVQGLVSCRKCGYALSRTSTRSSARKIHYYRCLGSDAWRHLGGSVCDCRPIRQDLLDQIVWQEVVRLIEDPTLIQAELDRRLDAARGAEPTKRRQDALERELTRIRKSVERLVTAYQEDLLPLDELRRRMPELRAREQSARAELQAILDQAADRMSLLRLAETLTAFLQRLHESAQSLEIVDRQKIVRLLVKDILVDNDTIAIRHSIPSHPRTPPPGTEPPSDGKSQMEGEGYLLRSGSDRRRLAECRASAQSVVPSSRSIGGCQPSFDSQSSAQAARHVFSDSPHQQSNGRCCRTKTPQTTHSQDFPTSVVITRRRHPFEGCRLAVINGLTRHGVPLLLVVLPDGSRSLIPSAWTDWFGSCGVDPPGDVEDGEDLCAVGDLIKARAVIDALLSRLAESVPREEGDHAVGVGVSRTARGAGGPDGGALGSNRSAGPDRSAGHPLASHRADARGRLNAGDKR